MIEQSRFLSTVFLCSEFKLENIYSGVNFCGKNVCGNFYLRKLIFADRKKKSQKLGPEKISCHTISLVEAVRGKPAVKDGKSTFWKW